MAEEEVKALIGVQMARIKPNNNTLSASLNKFNKDEEILRCL